MRQQCPVFQSGSAGSSTSPTNSDDDFEDITVRMLSPLRYVNHALTNNCDPFAA